MTLQIVSTGHGTVLFTDKPDGPPKPEEIASPGKFSAAAVSAAAAFVPPVIYEVQQSAESLPPIPVDEKQTPPPEAEQIKKTKK